MKKALFFIILFNSLSGYSQDFNWWNIKHNWDGTTHWSRYLILSPAYLGPNALPVPEIKNGSVREKASLELSFESHFSKGDNTQDLYTNFYTPLFSKNAGLNISYVPVEYFKMDTATRDIRKARDKDGEGFSSGDVYIGTLIQLVKDHERWPDMMISVNIKTASGGNLAGARFTDSPGYYFDFAAGKEFRFADSFLKSFRPYGMAGFYAWQTNIDDYFQNDAIIWGIGYSLKSEMTEFRNSLGGFSGYLRNGDRPVVFNAVLRTNLVSHVNYKVSFQHGMRDYLYNTFRLGCEIDLSYPER